MVYRTPAGAGMPLLLRSESPWPRAAECERSTSHMRRVGEFLDTLEENTFSVLYKCRWDRELADDVTRQLKSCLASAHDAEDLRRGLAALNRIGVPARAAIPEVIPLVWHEGDTVAQTAILTLASIGLETANEVVPVLIAAAAIDVLRKDAMFALICFGRSAESSLEVFREALKSPDARTRRLALRGVVSVAAAEVARQLVALSLADRSKQVRDYSQRLIARLKTKAEPSGAARGTLRRG